jgi:SRSO17 transposase
MEIPKAGLEPLVDLQLFLAPFGRLVRRAESRQAMERYTTGLVSGTSRKNATQLGRSLPGTNGQQLQELLTRTQWDPWSMDQLRIEHMCGYASVGNGVLVLDDTGFAKKGGGSVGVSRQYSGTLGRVDNCQILVTAHYVDRVFDWPVTARLYLPETWVDDRERRHKAQVPGSLVFQTKGEIALDLVDRANLAQVPFRVVVVDAGYGDQPSLLDGLVARNIPHVVGVSCATRFRLAELVDGDSGEQQAAAYRGRGRPRKASGLKERVPPQQAQELFAQLPSEAWQSVAWRNGVKGPLVKEFALLSVFRTGQRGNHLLVRGHLLAERSLSKSRKAEDLKYYFAWGLDTLSLAELVEIAHVRWVVERFYQDAKGELGLDHYEGRLWTGFHRHVALVMLAHCYLTLRQSYGPDVLAHGPPIQGGAKEAGRPSPARGFPPKGQKKHGRTASHCS